MEINKSKKKRKSSAGNDELEKTEEADMQIFFALVDNIREARLRLMNGSNVALNAAGIDQTDDYRSNKKKKKKKKLIEEEEQNQEKERSKQMFRNAAVWNPSLVFQHQDLREESQFKIPTCQISREGDEEGKSKDCNLDLTLSL